MNSRDMLLRLRSLILHRRVERELADELALHIELEARKNMAAGMSPEEAARQARIQFGGPEQVKEECRDARRVRLIETAWQDVRYALRGLGRSPVFFLTVVATIALGLGLNTALFTIFNAYYFHPIPVHDPESLYEFSWIDRSGAGHEFTWPEYREFLSENPAFSAALAYRYAEVRFEGRNLTCGLVTGGYFQMLGIGAALGRTLLPDDSLAPGSQPVVVLSYAAWQNQFAGDRDILGKKLLLRGFPFEVVGVAPAGFNGLASRPTDFWVPISMAARFYGPPDLFGPEHPRTLSIIGRLGPRFSVRQAEAGVKLWAQRFTAASPDAERAVGAWFISRATVKPFTPQSALLFSPILIAFLLVLLIACANVTNMMLARAVSRQREIGIRLSLGAARGRLIRQLLTESLLLAVPAAVAGFFVSKAMIGIGLRVMFATLPAGIASFGARVAPLSPDARVFAFSLAAAAASALLFGLAPALQSTRGDVMQAARGDFSGEFRPSRLRNALVIGQVTVCVLLLIVAGLLLSGVDQVQAHLPALSSRDAIEIVVQEKSRARVAALLASEPSVEILAAAEHAPVHRQTMVSIRPAEAGAILRTAANTVSREYFTVFEIPVLRGRNFTDAEARSGAAVAVISQTAAEQLWPNQEAIGQSLRLVPNRGAEAVTRGFQVVSVIGIARDEISRWIMNGEDKSLVYFPGSPQTASTRLFARVHGDADTVKRKLDADLAALDADAVEEIHKIQVRDWVTEETYLFRVAYWGSSAIGVLALLLTLSGIYGVLSHVVSQRTKEIGIRMAMGATTNAVTGLLLKQALRLGIIGTAIGGVLALGVLSACAGAAYFPSRRAARVDPIATLRYD
jgi:predicted permease